MASMPSKDYKSLDQFVRSVIEKVADGTLPTADGIADIMHPLTAWDNGNEQEFIPWIKQWLKDHP